MFIAIIAAVLLIGGVGGYILFGRSSDDKNSVSQSQQPVPTQQVPQTNEPAKPAPAPNLKPVEQPVQQFKVNQKSARNAFISFHAAITNRQLAEAYNILSPKYQKFMKNYDNFARGYTTTLRSDIVELNTISENANSATYSYKLKAVDREGNGTKTQYFVGKASLIRINGLWRLDSTDAKLASQNSKAAGNAASNSSKYSIKSGPYPVFLNGDPNYILVDGHMGSAWYIIKSSVKKEEISQDKWHIHCEVISATETGKISSGQPTGYTFFFDEKGRSAGVAHKGLRLFNYNGPRSETMVINGAGAMAYYIANGRKWPEFGFSNDTYSYADL